MAPRPLGKCPKCKTEFQNSGHTWPCFTCKRNFHSHCLGLPGTIVSKLKSLTLLKDSNALCCIECRTKLQTIDLEFFRRSKRRRGVVEEVEPTPGPSHGQSQAEIIQLQLEQIAVLQENIVVLRQHIDRIESTPLNSARTGSEMNTTRDSPDEPVTHSQLKEILKKSQVFVLEQMQKMLREMGNNLRTQSNSVPIRPSRELTFAEAVRNRSVSANRQRSASRGREPQTQPQPAQRKANPRQKRQQPLLQFNPAVSTAQAFDASPIELANRFNILSTIDDDNDNFTIMNEIQGSSQLATIGRIKTVVKRPNRCLAVETETEADASHLKVEILAKYPRGITITTPQVRKPLLKVTGCAVADVTAENLKTANPWLTNEITIVRYYDVGREPRIYRNFIIENNIG